MKLERYVSKFEESVKGKQYGLFVEKEASWGIKEKLPIDVFLSGRSISVPPMSMTYKTWNYLDGNHIYKHKLSDPDVNKYGDLQIGISQFQYSYGDGRASFTALSKEEAERWAEKYKKYVTLNIR